MNDISGHNGVVVGVEHARSSSMTWFKSSVVVLQDGSRHQFNEGGYRGATRARELDRMIDVSQARRMLVLWVPRKLSRWKRGEGYLCLGRLWIQTTAPAEPKSIKS